MIEILKFTYAIVLFQQFIFIVVLIFKSRLKTKQQVIALLILLSLFFCVGDRVINIYGAYFAKEFPWTIFILDTFNLAYLPLLFLFVKTVTLRKMGPYWKELIHFIPFAYNFFLVFFCYTLQPTTEQRALQQSFNKPGFFFTSDYSYYLIEYSRFLQIIYVVIAIRWLWQFRLNLKYNTAQKSTFLNLLMILSGAFVLLWIIGIGFSSQLEKSLFPFIDLLIISTSALFIYFGFKEPKELLGIQLSVETLAAFKPKDYTKFKRQLDEFINSNQSYLDPEITLQKLSETSGISVRILSGTINNCYQMHFFDYINSLRVEKAKKILKESNKTVLEILYSVGFNSKSAFNRAFLKQAGCTPSQFRKIP